MFWFIATGAVPSLRTATSRESSELSLPKFRGSKLTEASRLSLFVHTEKLITGGVFTQLDQKILAQVCV